MAVMPLFIGASLAVTAAFHAHSHVRTQIQTYTSTDIQTHIDSLQKSRYTC